MAHLPPKVPNMSPSWPDFPSFHKMSSHANFSSTPNLGTINNTSHYHHNNNSNTNNNPSWVDEFLDFSSARRGAHRRSVSDSVTFLEAPVPTMRAENNDNEFDKLDDDQFMMSVFNDEVYGDNNAPPTLSSSNPSSTSDQNFNNEEKETSQQEKNEKEVEGEQRKQEEEEEEQKHHHQLKSEPEEVESECKQDITTQAKCDTNTTTTSNDKITDPKRVKRILANRQSAQRSRVRKLQYITELERSVTSLQAEVSVLSPRVAFLDHQRLLLNVDNSAIKQRIAALAQDKIFKDAHQDALKREIERLRQVYHQQNLKKMEYSAGSPSPTPSPKPGCDAQTEMEQQLLLNV